MAQEKSATQILEEKYPTIANGYKQIMLEQYELFSQKHLSYGMDNISMGTRLKNREEKKLSFTSIYIRLNDKMNRLKNLVLFNRENTVKDESISDTWRDISNYGIIAQLVERDMWKEDE